MSSSTSRRRSRSRSRERNRNSSSSSSKLRMDTKPVTPRITDPSVPAGRRREIDTVMKRARASPNSYWDKKLLEVEAKDPHRWRHTGYKSMYLDDSSSAGSGSPARRRSRSPPTGSGRRSSPPLRRGPAALGGRRPSPLSPSVPPPGTSRRSPLGPPTAGPYGRATASSRTSQRPHSPSAHRHGDKGNRRHRSASPGSTISSCSDDSCSVCSPKHRRPRSRSRSYSLPRSRINRPAKSGGMSPPKSRVRPRPPSPSSPPGGARRMPRPMTPPPQAKRQQKSDGNQDRPTDPRRQPPPPRPRLRTGEVIDVAGGVKPPARSNKPKNKGSEPVLLTKIKKERGTRGDSSASEDSDTSTASPIVATTRLSLSERFGKIAQWSADRERREMENMRITKTGGDLKVMIERDAYTGYGSPPRRYSLSPVPAGHYPDELISSGHSGWDDVRVRYQYYKDLGYLRDLSLEDYVKWEEWWYKYQDWLDNERHYERWASSNRRRSRKRLPASQRLN